MATKPDIATNLAYQDLLSENQKKHEGLRKRQKTITSLPRTLRINQRNKFIVLNQKRTGTKFKTGFVPVKSTSLAQQSSPPISVSSRKRYRIRLLSKSRLAPLSERTFRKNPNAKYHRYRKISDTKVDFQRLKSGAKLRKAMTEKVLTTTNTWVPGLKKTNFTHSERPFLKPLNAIEQLLNDEIVQPTTNYYHGFRDYINTRLEPTTPVKEPPIFKSNKIIELLESEQGLQQPRPSEVTEGNSKKQTENQENRPDSTKTYVNKAKKSKETHDRVEGVFLFVRVSQVGIFAKLFAKRLKFDRIIGRKDRNAEVDDFIEQVEVVQSSPSRDTLNALRRDRAPVVLLSACLSFQFGPPIRPYSPAKSGPQLIMSPLLTLSCDNLFLSPGKEVYLAQTIDLYDVRTERMKRILRVRFALKNASESDLGSPVEFTNPSVHNSLQRITSHEVLQADFLSPASCILSNDPNLNNYMLPLDSGHTLKSPVLNGVENPKSDESFTEFGYQIINTGDKLVG